MFVFDKIAEGNISTHQFEITGSTYAPEGDMWVFRNLLVHKKIPDAVNV